MKFVQINHHQNLDGAAALVIWKKCLAAVYCILILGIVTLHKVLLFKNDPQTKQKPSNPCHIYHSNRFSSYPKHCLINFHRRVDKRTKHFIFRPPEKASKSSTWHQQAFNVKINQLAVSAIFVKALETLTDRSGRVQLFRLSIFPVPASKFTATKRDLTKTSLKSQNSISVRYKSVLTFVQ